jgi:diaminopimelate decarboxylase
MTGSGDGMLADGQVAGLEPEWLAARFGTPLYVYDLDLIERRVAALRAALPAVFDLAYAVKANPSLAVIGFVGRLGLGADVASGGELTAALRAGVPRDHIVFTGPGKRDDELEAAVAARIRAVTVESPGELERLDWIAARLGLPVPVLLRAAVTAADGSERVRLIGDSGAGKFGMDPPGLAGAAERAASSSHLELLGLHAFGASNVLDASVLAGHVATTVETAASLADSVGAPLRLVDVGGGLGIPYASDESPLDLDELSARLHALVTGWAADPRTREMRVLYEPGRYLVGPAGTYLARVVDRKTAHGRTVVILDGGVHHVLRPALVGQPHRVVSLPDGATRRGGGGRPAAGAAAGPVVAPGIAATGAASGRVEPVTVAGPLCTGLDILSTAPMSPPEPGDLVAVLDVGAYGFTESMPLFLSHPIPAEVAIRGGRAELIRPRLEPEAWLVAQRIPEW